MTTTSDSTPEQEKSTAAVVPKQYLYPFILVTMPRLQGQIIDMDEFTFGSMTLESVRVSFVLPLICFFVIAVYGFTMSGRPGPAKARD